MATAQVPIITRFPAEWEPHELTFMQWPMTRDWGSRLGIVQQEVAGLAKAIANYERVVVLVTPDQVTKAQGSLDYPNIQIEKIHVDDLWARDTMPAFTFLDKQPQGASFNFNGWGNRQKNLNDYNVASKIIERYGLSQVKSWLVAEGGALENDGAGTLLATESSLVNENRNPGKSRDDIEKELKRTLGIEKVIWFDGVRGKDITDAHVDCLARFIRPHVILLNRLYKGAPANEWSRASDQAREVLETTKDAHGHSFQIIEMNEPDPSKFEPIGEEFVSSYVNFYIVNGAVIIPRFGDQDADRNAEKIMADNFPGREIVSVSISNIASGGGGIHCATHELPAMPSSA